MSEARYIYCIANRDEEKTFGRIGLEKSPVYTIPWKEICVVVHDCVSSPYQSEDQETVRSWLVSHERVIETAWEHFGNVLPLGFDTIVKPDEENDAPENIKKWLMNDYKKLKQKFKKLEGKAEFGVQVFWYPQAIAQKLMETHQQLRNLNKEIQSKPPGMAYLYKQKLDTILRNQMEKEAQRYFEKFYKQIDEKVEEVKVEKVKKSEDEKQMIMNLSCLSPSENSKDLGDDLEKIDKKKEFSVRFTGPWPPYSFVQ
ncbi:GvpL/GvpF family gas vesicle protein [bacterium]|nr:GvpL/GvpF family gas vesicle protein [bacterium]